MDKKLKAFVSNAEKSTKILINKAVQSIDQNDDGKFDLTDITEIADSMGDSMKKGAQAMQESAEEKARQLELKALQPIFPDSLDGAEFILPKFIRIVEREKKYIDSKVCQGSIGYTSNPKGLRVVNIFSDSVDTFGLMFYPDRDSELYYIDPSERDRYIALDDYFGYLKIARVNELQKIAQDLGAKYFKVTYKEEQTSFTERKAKVKTQAKPVGSIDAHHEHSEKRYSTVEIAAENHFPGHPPVMPQVKYMQRDPSIQNLIAMRMDETSPLQHQKIMIKMSNSSGMKENDAVKIDAALKSMKCIGNTTLANEVKNESRRYLEYEIEF